MYRPSAVATRDFLQETFPCVSLHGSNLHHLHIMGVYEVRLDLRRLLDAENLKYFYIGCTRCSIVPFEDNTLRVDGEELYLTIAADYGIDSRAATQLEHLGLDVSYDHGGFADGATSRWQGPKKLSRPLDSHFSPKPLSQICSARSTLKQLSKASEVYTDFGSSAWEHTDAQSHLTIQQNHRICAG